MAIIKLDNNKSKALQSVLSSVLNHFLEIGFGKIRVTGKKNSVYSMDLTSLGRLLPVILCCVEYLSKEILAKKAKEFSHMWFFLQFVWIL